MKTFAKIALGLPIKGQNAITDLTGNAVPLSNLFTKVVDSTLAMFVPYISAGEIEWYWS